VSDNRDLFTSSHAGMGGSRFKRVSPGTINRRRGITSGNPLWCLIRFFKME